MESVMKYLLLSALLLTTPSFAEMSSVLRDAFNKDIELFLIKTINESGNSCKTINHILIPDGVKGMICTL
jgi:hypothetical protein